MLEPSLHKTNLLQKECFFAKKIAVNGMMFSTDMWLPDLDSNKRVHEIFDIIVTDPKNVTDIFAVCRTYVTVTHIEHFCAFSVKKESVQKDLCLINIKEFLSQHHYPVKVHKIGQDYLFRCKRF